MTTANVTMWDLTQIDNILWDKNTGEEAMSDSIFQFYSDTNQSNALDELEGMALDEYYKIGTTIKVSKSDMDAMGDSIEAIVKANGGEVI